MFAVGVFVLLLSGCSNNIPQNNEINSPSTPITIKLSTNQDIPPANAKDPLDAAKAAMSWDLSNGKTVRVTNNSDVLSKLTLGNVAVVSFKVPEVNPQINYILIMVRNGGNWALGGIIGAPIIKQQKIDLPDPYSNYTHVSTSMKNVGIFTELYTDKTVVSIANISISDPNLPSGKKIHLSSGKIATLFKDGDENGLYYRVGTHVILIGGNISKDELLKLASSKNINTFLFF